ncbi:MAG: glycosyltransferase family 2 protein [Sulfolobales archaeon]
MLTLKLGVFLIFFMPLLCVMLIHTSYFLASSKYRGEFKESPTNSGGGRRVTVIVPVKNEPLELIDELINSLERVCSSCELILISDDPKDKALKIRELCEAKASKLQNVEIKFLEGDPVSGGRVKALNRGVLEAKYDYILILDVDSRPEEGFIDKLVWCVESGYDACVGRWESYQSSTTRLALSIGRVMKFTVDVLYKGRSALGFFIFPLGSGTLFRKDSLLAVGLWDEVIQDDMYIGMKFLINGFKTNYVDNAVVKVLVPSLFTSLKVQQSRWAYGALEVLRRKYGEFIRSKVSIIKKLEVIIFLGQYIPTSLFFLGSLVVPLIAVLLGDDLINFGLIPTALSITVFLAYAIGLYRSLSTNNISKFVAIRTMGSSAAVTVALLPTIFTGTLKSLLTKRTYYRVTPKGSYERLTPSRYLSEFLYLTYLLVASTINFLVGNLLTALWCYSLMIAVLYVIVRANKLVTTNTH